MLDKCFNIDEISPVYVPGRAAVLDHFSVHRCQSNSFSFSEKKDDAEYNIIELFCQPSTLINRDKSKCVYTWTNTQLGCYCQIAQAWHSSQLHTQGCRFHPVSRMQKKGRSPFFGCRTTERIGDDIFAFFLK